uniref:Putative secreted protein n=1 Tax=Anopheles triannulatus TaxID=58253 RepID=A0A2M4B5V7_9DIPT
MLAQFLIFSVISRISAPFWGNSGWMFVSEKHSLQYVSGFSLGQTKTSSTLLTHLLAARVRRQFSAVALSVPSRPAAGP